MKKTLLLGSALCLIVNVSFGQFSEFSNEDMPSSFTLSSDNNTLQIGGRVSAYYEWRDLKQGNVNMDHNSFTPKDIDMDFLGKTTSKFTYELQVSFLDLANAAATQNTADPTAPGIKAAYVEYGGWPVKIKLGYDKLPFSQGSMQDNYNTPFWSHANLYGGDFFSRRDIGLTLNSTLWKQRINLYAGMYSGLGENTFEYGEDASGSPEFIGRAEFSYPGKVKYRTIDMEGAPTPIFRIAVDARYENKTQPAGHTVEADVPDALGPYDTRIIDGKRLIYGGDAIFKYRHFSALFESDIINMNPQDATNGLYEGTPVTFNKGVVHAGGLVTGVNYDWRKARSVFSVQYEDINSNDLLAGHQEWLTVGYAYTVNRFNSVFKIEWYKPLTEDVAADPLKYTNQIRAGYQVVF